MKQSVLFSLFIRKSIGVLINSDLYFKTGVLRFSEHQHTLEEVFAQTSDGIRRRQLLEELQKENRERLKCLVSSLT